MPIDPKAKGKGASKPEPTDNRVRTVVFERLVEDELLRITEPAAVKLASQRLAVSLLDGENKVLESLSLNISELLWHEKGHVVSLLIADHAD